MFIINNASELLSKKLATDVIPNEVYIKENNLKLINGYNLTGNNDVCFIELENNIMYEFQHNYRGGTLQQIITDLFNENDVDISLYFLVHTYHKAIDSLHDGYFAITNHPQYTQFINTADFKFQIRQYRPNRPLFSPFKKEKKQNLDTRINSTKFVRAILAGQISRVVCNGICTDNWAYDEDVHNQKGQWDIYDFANHLCNLSDSFQITKKDINVLSAYYSAGEHSESFTVYLETRDQR